VKGQVDFGKIAPTEFAQQLVVFHYAFTLYKGGRMQIAKIAEVGAPACYPLHNLATLQTLALIHNYITGR